MTEHEFNNCGWRTSKKGNPYKALDDGRCVTIFTTTDAYVGRVYRFSVSDSDGSEPLFCEETFTSKDSAKVGAWTFLFEDHGYADDC